METKVQVTGKLQEEVGSLFDSMYRIAVKIPEGVTISTNRDGFKMEAAAGSVLFNRVVRSGMAQGAGYVLTDADRAKGAAVLAKKRCGMAQGAGRSGYVLTDADRAKGAAVLAKKRSGALPAKAGKTPVIRSFRDFGRRYSKGILGLVDRQDEVVVARRAWPSSSARNSFMHHIRKVGYDFTPSKGWLRFKIHKANGSAVRSAGGWSRGKARFCKTWESCIRTGERVAKSLSDAQVTTFKTMWNNPQVTRKVIGGSYGVNVKIVSAIGKALSLPSRKAMMARHIHLRRVSQQ